MAQKKKPQQPARRAAPKSKVQTRPPAAPRRKAAPRSAPFGAGDPVEQIQRVIDVMVAAGAVEVELEDGGLKLRVRLKGEVPVPMMPYAAAPAAPAAAAVRPAEAAPAAPVAAVDDPKRTVFKSPMVGTFYRSAAPDADPFVEVGDRVGPDTTLCILEAMKVMNEIKAETSGQVVEVLAQNGEPVEFGQPLFVIKAD